MSREPLNEAESSVDRGQKNDRASGKKRRDV